MIIRACFPQSNIAAGTTRNNVTAIWADRQFSCGVALG